ncbi:MAG: ribosome silencing factor [Leptonema sp. (in: bacteria)]
MKQTKTVLFQSQQESIRKLAKELVLFLENKKMQEILLLNIEKVNPYFCFFILATANSSLQLKSIHKELYKNFFNLMDKKNNPLSETDSGWVVYDFIDIIVHIFLEETRSYYNLEKLWADAPIIYSSKTKQFQW